MTQIRHYKEFDVYQKAYRAALKLHRLADKFPKSEYFGLADQVKRSSKSITVNFAEGFSRNLFSRAEFKRFLVMAVGSCDETKVWLDYAKDLGYILNEEHQELYLEYEEIGRMLYALWKKSF